MLKGPAGLWRKFDDLLVSQDIPRKGMGPISKMVALLSGFLS